MSKWELIEKRWPTMSARVKRQWSKLEDVDLAFVAGKEELLVRKLTEHYGLHQDDAQRQVFQWAAGLADIDLVMPVVAASVMQPPGPPPPAHVVTAPATSLASDSPIAK